MMKETTRKLTLHRESLHRLEVRELATVKAAAGSHNTACPICHVTEVTCYGTCTC
jgi:hypothetical protein